MSKEQNIKAWAIMNKGKSIWRSDIKWVEIFGTKKMANDIKEDKYGEKVVPVEIKILSN